VDLAVYSFGQNFTLTPLQLVTAVSAVANGGMLVQPHIVKEILNADGTVAQSFGRTEVRQVISQQTSELMCDMLEEENPGCFDDPDKTFIDIYMKSGLYLAEIVKRLYRSKKMQELYPDKNKRLQHIFSKQIYGLAPTVTIYNIVKNYALGFDVNGDIIGDNHNIRQFDSAPSCAEKKLPEDLNKIFNL
jgi:hypothetical protein